MERFYTLRVRRRHRLLRDRLRPQHGLPLDVARQDYHGMDYKTLEDLAAEPSRGVRPAGERPSPRPSRSSFGDLRVPTSEAYAEALQRGRDIYAGQACWHCHSQYVREVSNEERALRAALGRPGVPERAQPASPVGHAARRARPVARARQAHQRLAHRALHQSRRTSCTNSVMPLLRATTSRKTRTCQDEDGFSLVTYVQWIGSEYGCNWTPRRMAAMSEPKPMRPRSSPARSCTSSSCCFVPGRRDCIFVRTSSSPSSRTIKRDELAGFAFDPIVDVLLRGAWASSSSWSGPTCPASSATSSDAKHEMMERFEEQEQARRARSSPREIEQ